MDFPFADAAGIIRANQKDLFVENDLLAQIKDVLQGYKGVRFTHNWAAQIQAASTLLYLGLTSLAGSRTLGEEYTDIFYLTPDRKIPSNVRIGMYVLASGLTPLVLPRLALTLRNSIRKLREKHRTPNSQNIEKTTSDYDQSSDEEEDDDEEEESFLEQMLTPANLVSFNTAVFYFSGAYYQLSKRILGLKYAIGRRADPLSPPSGSYELIGLLIIARAVFKVIAQVNKRWQKTEKIDDKKTLPQNVGPSLKDATNLPFIHGQARQCNLCLEEMRAPTVTLCGHLYCWSCIAEWCRDQSECPLCRQECHEQHLLCLRV